MFFRSCLQAMQLYGIIFWILWLIVIIVFSVCNVYVVVAYWGDEMLIFQVRAFANLAYSNFNSIVRAVFFMTDIIFIVIVVCMCLYNVVYYRNEENNGRDLIQRRVRLRMNVWDG